jgi:hypothetical protein
MDRTESFRSGETFVAYAAKEISVSHIGWSRTIGREHA